MLMRRLIIVTLIWILSAVPVLAHDGSEHTSDLEMWVAGFGIVLIVGMGIYTLRWNRLHADELIEFDSFEADSEQFANE